MTRPAALPRLASALVAAIPMICAGMEAWGQVGSNAECRMNPHLARAREQYDELLFEEVAQTLQRAIEYSSNCKSDLAEIYRLKAFVDAVVGEPERCHRDFEVFLALSPSWSIPAGLPPKILGCYEAVMLVPPRRRELRVETEHPRESLPNTPVSLKVRVVDPLRLVDQIKVYFRRQGVKVFTIVSARADDDVAVVIPALALPPDPEGYDVEYLVRAVDRWDGVLAEDGTPSKPATFAVSPEAQGVSWWVWTAVGVGAVGLGLSIALAAQGSRDAVTLTVHDGSLRAAR